MRGPWARRLTDLIDLHLSDLGGLDVTSEAERSIARRACVLEIELERLEARFAVGEAQGDEIDLYSRMTNTLCRLLESLGLQRRAKDVTTSLHEYIASLPPAREAAGESVAPAVAPDSADEANRIPEAPGPAGGAS